MRLRIARVRLRRVRIPLRIVYVSSMYVMPATYRTVIELEASDGSVGLGETLGTEDVFRLTARLASRWIGADPWNRRALDQEFARSIFDNRNGRNGWSAAAGLEMAAYDLTARSLGLPLSSLWGGAARTRIPVVSPLPAIVLEAPLDRDAIAGRFADRSATGAVAAFACELRDRAGIGHFKYKSAAGDPAWDVAVMTALRTELGPGAGLRFDPNAAYPIDRALALCEQLEPLGLEFYEDPTDDLEGLAAVKARFRTPVATNMFVIQTDQLAAAVRRRAVDVVLADVYMWGGIDRLRSAAVTAAAFGLEVGIHSLFETGIGTALNLHLAAALPELTRASDTGLHWLAQDVVTGADLAIAGGCLTVPGGPGLGVTLDEAAMTELTVEQEVIDAG
jgi:glucarate dehydratase